MAAASPNGLANGDSAGVFAGGSVSPGQMAAPKKVTFELLFTETQTRGRLPMRVRIHPHDTTDSIVTTVKNFYGLYSGPAGSKGVSFEDQDGVTLIARYENFSDDMVVYVRVTEENTAAQKSPFNAPSYNTEPTPMQPYYQSDAYPLQAPVRLAGEPSGPIARSPHLRSPSPNGVRGRRSASANTNPHGFKKGRSRSARNGESMANGQVDLYSDSMNGYSSGDGAASTASGRAKEHLGNTEISLENIVEGTRRKRAKFESSELPLFAPPQMPAATSNPSVSPARRIDHHRPSLPGVQLGHNPFANPHPLQSPQSYGNGYGQGKNFATPVSESRRTRGSIGGYRGQSGQMGSANGILPTPDPTVGSCVSEEDKDVAIQLMRLGEMSNISHGRTSASTLDDTFSGRADAASSTGATSDGESDSEEEMPESRRQRLDATGAMRKIYHTTESHFIPQPTTETNNIHPAGYDNGMNGSHRDDTRADGPSKPKTSLPDGANTKTTLGLGAAKSSKSASKTLKAPRPNGNTKSKKVLPSAASNGAMSPPSQQKPAISAPLAMVAGAGDEEQVDLSAKPRCQRCRKSKKGCDRQRPCGRCRDAGLNADQCISEDEGNGRKGRYGRHMGVPIKKEEITNPNQPLLLPAAPIAMTALTIDKNKKRKR